MFLFSFVGNISFQVYKEFTILSPILELYVTNFITDYMNMTKEWLFIRIAFAKKLCKCV